MENKIEIAAFEIISCSGNAKALFLEAVDFALEFEFEKAEAKIKEGKKLLNDTHKSHLDLLTLEANNELSGMSLLLTHAEDQFMSAEESLILAQKIMKMMKKFENKLK